MTDKLPTTLEVQSPPRDMRHSLPIALLRARESVMSLFRPMLAKHDVTEQQWRVLRVLAENGRLDATELAERASVLAPSLTRILRSLDERGVVRRAKDDGDGRRVLVEIAPAGLAIIEKVLPESRAIYARIERAYGKERIDALVELLDDLSYTDWNQQ